MEEVTFACDSLLEGTGFEPSVPRDTTNLSSRLWLVPANRKVGAKENRPTKRRALPPLNRWFESISLHRRASPHPHPLPPPPPPPPARLHPYTPPKPPHSLP